tara:strand:- start:526 stop:1071 length:546 start_codon:yes stop_codon:yes gene_type:complete
MPNNLFETDEQFLERHKAYVRGVLDREKGLMPCGHKIKETTSWSIIKRSGGKAIGDVFSVFYKVLQNIDLEYTKPLGTSFRIIPPKNSFIYIEGISKIIISMDLRKNEDILKRTSKKEYIVEVSIHDMKENYGCCDKMGYTKNSYIKIFDNTDFDQNMDDLMREVYRILTFTGIDSNNKCR